MKKNLNDFVNIKNALSIIKKKQRGIERRICMAIHVFLMCSVTTSSVCLYSLRLTNKVQSDEDMEKINFTS